ncbi:hypothetical protein Y032_0012g1781 [Ancylostoma ceylanicum]|nr:hypothetical protein Y032_0012g1781 [Ancylostoma ceylanicum]
MKEHRRGLNGRKKEGNDGEDRVTSRCAMMMRHVEQTDSNSLNTLVNRPSKIFPKPQVFIEEQSTTPHFTNPTIQDTLKSVRNC